MTQTAPRDVLLSHEMLGPMESVAAGVGSAGFSSALEVPQATVRREAAANETRSVFFMVMTSNALERAVVVGERAALSTLRYLSVDRSCTNRDWRHSTSIRIRAHPPPRGEQSPEPGRKASVSCSNHGTFARSGGGRVDVVDPDSYKTGATRP